MNSKGLIPISMGINLVKCLAKSIMWNGIIILMCPNYNDSWLIPTWATILWIILLHLLYHWRETIFLKLQMQILKEYHYKGNLYVYYWYLFDLINYTIYQIYSIQFWSKLFSFVTCVYIASTSTTMVIAIMEMSCSLTQSQQKEDKSLNSSACLSSIVL